MWTCPEDAADGTDPSPPGSRKVAEPIFDFLREEPAASAWYLA